jgi:hypothetical protein
MTSIDAVANRSLMTSMVADRIPTPEVFERHEPVRLASHDAEDGMWQPIGASAADGDTGKVGHLRHAVDEDLSLIDVLNLPPGRSAERAGPGRPWTGTL